jgi:hypothetical protein
MNGCFPAALATFIRLTNLDRQPAVTTHERGNDGSESHRLPQDRGPFRGMPADRKVRVVIRTAAMLLVPVSRYTPLP